MAPNVNNKNPYKTREGGCTCTVFVPYDCNNNCPFCVNKKEYADTSKFSAEKIIESIKTIDEITPLCDFVFTGGEPLANLASLQKMLDAVPTTHKIYINTTFPIQPNISGEQFRYDYTETTPENLYDEEHDLILQDLMNHFTYIGLDGCRMRNGFHFKYYMEEIGKWERMTYHKTLPYSTIEEKDPESGITYNILYDILIKQNGDFHSDWDNTPLDIDRYRKVVFEPYDLKFLYKDEKEWLD